MREQTTKESTPRLFARLVDCATEWDSAIDCLGGHILQGWRWGEAKSRHGWVPRRLLISDGDEAVAAAQMLVRRVGPLSVAYVPRGPVVGEAHDQPTISAVLTQALDRQARRARAVVLFVEPDRPWQSMPFQGSLGWRRSSAVFQPERTIKVPVNLSDDDLLAAMKSKTRYNVRLAGRRGVTVRRGTLADLPTFYQLLEETRDRDNFGIHSVEYYRDVIAAYGDDVALLIAEYDGEAAAAIVVVRDGREAIYLYGASTTRHQRHMPAYLIQYEAMRWARDAGCVAYDLWGIPPSDEPPPEVDGDATNLNVRSGLWGVYRFKQGFGGEIVSYPGVFERPYIPALVNLWRRFGPGIG